jgi:aspartate/methionine/tyrosine aminotransferase
VYPHKIVASCELRVVSKKMDDFSGPGMLNSPLTTHQCESGWYGILRAPKIKTDEDWAVELLEKRNVHLFPGYFFDFQTEGNLVISLLVEEENFKQGIKEIRNHVEASLS